MGTGRRPDTPKASITPADAKTHARVTAVFSAIVQFATVHAWVVRKGIFEP
jgi:hypothetical protein